MGVNPEAGSRSQGRWMRWGWCPHGGQDNASRLRWPFPPLPFGGLSAAPLPSCSLFRAPQETASRDALGLSGLSGARRCPGPRHGGAWVRSVRAAGLGAGERGLSGRATPASVTLSFLSVQGLRGKMTFSLPISKGQWKVTGGTRRTQADVRRTERLPQARGDAGGTSYRRQAPRATERRAGPCFRKAERVSRARVRAPGIPNPAAVGEGSKGHLVQSPASGQASPAEASCVLPRAGAQVRAAREQVGAPGGEEERSLPAAARGAPAAMTVLRGAGEALGRGAPGHPHAVAAAHTQQHRGRQEERIRLEPPPRGTAAERVLLRLAGSSRQTRGPGAGTSLGPGEGRSLPSAASLGGRGPRCGPGQGWLQSYGAAGQALPPAGVLRARRPLTWPPLDQGAVVGGGPGAKLISRRSGAHPHSRPLSSPSCSSMCSVLGQI